VYETVLVLGRRANQVATAVKEELGAKLEEFNVISDSLEEVMENKEQIEVSKHYEKMPKPAAIAIQELMEGKLFVRRPDEVSGADGAK
jgi:DNA-directed RNA polymerase subunit K/omega